MAPFVRVAFWLFTLNVTTSDASRTDFDWSRFAGVFRFGECSQMRGPVWADRPDKTHVAINVSRDDAVYPPKFSLNVVRKNDEWHPIGLAWSFRDINAGLQVDERGRTWQSHTIADGIHGALSWNDPHSVGFTTLRLRMDASGGVSYEMVQTSELDQVGVRRERCALIRQSDQE